MLKLIIRYWLAQFAAQRAIQRFGSALYALRSLEADIEDLKQIARECRAKSTKAAVALAKAKSELSSARNK